MSGSTEAAGRLLAEGMAAFRQATEEEERVAVKISQQTRKLMWWILWLLLLLSLMILWQIWVMRADLMSMVEILQDMFLRFQVMAANLELMTGQMASIQSRVADLPGVAGNMTAITVHTKDIRWTMASMTTDVGTLAADVGRLQATTAEMAGHFREVQLAVGALSHNVEQLMRPMSLMPR